MAIVSYTIDELPPMTEEWDARLKALAEMPDDDIDFSDIPRLTDEELENFRPRRVWHYTLLAEEDAKSV